MERTRVKKQYQIGKLQLEIVLPNDMQIPENMEIFCSPCDQVEMHYEIQWVPELKFPEIETQIREEYPVKQEFRRENIRILNLGEKECRLLNFHGTSWPYAICLEEAKNRMKIWVAEEIRDLTIYDTVFVSLLALEKRMIERGELILHSAYMCREGQAILFSAPSETGKSTQANLWEKYRHTRTINGDRSLLIREEDGWYAYGWPVCGSSEICHNESYPIQAIVMLHQAKENEIELLKTIAAFQKLMAQITINMWNPDFQMKAFDLIEELIKEVPVFELGCDISEGAVECLEGALEER